MDRFLSCLGENILSCLNPGAFILQYAVCCLLFVLPLRRQNHFVLRILAALALHIVLGCVFLTVVDILGIHRSVAFLVTFLTGVGMFLLCSQIDVWDSIFGAACAFAVQHMCYAVHSFLEALLPFHSEVSSAAVKYLIFLGLTICCFFLFAIKLPVSGRCNVHIAEAVRSVIIVLPFAFYLSMLAEYFYAQDEAGNLPLFLISRVYAVLCCVFVLWVQTSINERVNVETEYRVQRTLWQQQRDQYQLSRENIDIINRKCHDLKHQVAALRAVQNENQRSRYLDEMEKSVMIYDSAVKTGNEVLDTILTERSLSCEKEGISWTCMADGKHLDFMDPVDLYTIFGNVLDNAIESVRQLKDPERRIVSVTLYSKPNMTVLQVENYYDHELQFSDGLPATSKGDQNYHGFGLKSIRSTVEKYGGSLSIDAQEHIFLLCIVLPTP